MTRPRRSICRDRTLAGNRSCRSGSRSQLERRAGREAGSEWQAYTSDGLDGHCVCGNRFAVAGEVRCEAAELVM